jgi:hypothetical protein
LLCISLDFSPPITIFNFEKHCFQLIIFHYVEIHRIQLSFLQANSFRSFSLGVLLSLGIEGPFHQLLPS